MKYVSFGGLSVGPNESVSGSPLGRDRTDGGLADRRDRVEPEAHPQYVVEVHVVVDEVQERPVAAVVLLEDRVH